MLVDSNGVEEPLLARVGERRITITHVLVTHQHADHVVDVAGLARRFGVAGVGTRADEGGRRADRRDVRRRRRRPLRRPRDPARIATPGHCPDHLALLVNGTDCLTADCLFKGTVGGTTGGGPTGYADQVDSIMNRLMSLPHETRLHPGHTLPSTIGDEWEHEPVHPHLARASIPRAPSRAACAASEATLILFGPDYDGTHKAWVRYPDGRDAIVGGSQIER